MAGIRLRGSYIKYLGDLSITDNVIRDAQIGIELSDISSSASTSMPTPTPTPSSGATPTPVPAGSGGIEFIPTISRIDFINNTQAVKLENVDSTVTIPVSDSYWGTTDLGEISDLIYDSLDDFNLGTVQVVNPVASPIH